jgi:hypothetical protein
MTVIKGIEPAFCAAIGVEYSPTQRQGPLVWFQKKQLGFFAAYMQPEPVSGFCILTKH